MAKFFGFVCILFLSVFLFFPQQSYAHFAATDGNITVVLHVDPGDDPIPGQQAHLFFLFHFNDATKKFNLNECDCIVSVAEQGKQISQQQLIDKPNPNRSIWGASMPFVFPRRDVYVIAIKGSPKTPNAFKPFFLPWTFRVAEYPQQSQAVQETSDPTFPFFAIGFLCIITFSATAIFFTIRSLNKTELDKKK